LLNVQCMYAWLSHCFWCCVNQQLFILHDSAFVCVAKLG
jgi:hypothetical protein